MKTKICSYFLIFCYIYIYLSISLPFSKIDIHTCKHILLYVFYFSVYIDMHFLICIFLSLQQINSLWQICSWTRNCAKFREMEKIEMHHRAFPMRIYRGTYGKEKRLSQVQAHQVEKWCLRLGMRTERRKKNLWMWKQIQNEQRCHMGFWKVTCVRLTWYQFRLILMRTSAKRDL